MTDDVASLIGALRTTRECDRQRLQACLEEILRVVDSLDRMCTCESVPQAELMILRDQFLAMLKNQEVHPIETVGHKFDPQQYVADGQCTDSPAPPGTVIRESLRGYMWGDQILRPPHVHIAASTRVPHSGPEPESERTQDGKP